MLNASNSWLRASSLTVIFLLVAGQNLFGQEIDDRRIVNWSTAGLSAPIESLPTELNMADYGAHIQSIIPNDDILDNALADLNGEPGVIYFPPGFYLFEQPINMYSGLVLRGAGADSTILRFDLKGAGNCVNFTGVALKSTAQITSGIIKDQSSVKVDAHDFQPGDYYHLIQNDDDLVESAWAKGSVGQIGKVARVEADQLHMETALRFDYELQYEPYVVKVDPIKNAGLECLTVYRLDQSEGQTSNIFFKYAAECWITGVESRQCNFAHISINQSTNLWIYGSYFQTAFSYGSGGKAYGIALQGTSGEVLIENNVFRRLRHSVLLQSGANGNVISYNYSVSPHWTDVFPLPADAAGDLVLHGNFPYYNLFESNIAQNLVIDDSHGYNGPFNTFFRNRLEKYGIFMNNNPASNRQNFIGNEVTNNVLGMYNLKGNEHYGYGNNLKGAVEPAGTSDLARTSMYLSNIAEGVRPNGWVSEMTWPAIGFPNRLDEFQIPARMRLNEEKAEKVCIERSILVGIEEDIEGKVSVYPNPSTDIININWPHDISFDSWTILDLNGKTLSTGMVRQDLEISVSGLPAGVIVLKLVGEQNQWTRQVLIK